MNLRFVLLVVLPRDLYLRLSWRPVAVALRAGNPLKDACAAAVVQHPLLPPRVGRRAPGRRRRRGRRLASARRGRRRHGRLLFTAGYHPIPAGYQRIPAGYFPLPTRGGAGGREGAVRPVRCPGAGPCIAQEYVHNRTQARRGAGSCARACHSITTKFESIKCTSEQESASQVEVEG